MKCIVIIDRIIALFVSQGVNPFQMGCLAARPPAPAEYALCEAGALNIGPPLNPRKLR